MSSCEHVASGVRGTGGDVWEALSTDAEVRNQAACRVGAWEWRAWGQRGRPASGKADSAMLMYLAGASGLLLEGIAVTVTLAKDMSDEKFL
jgi:hypothetical protein